MKIEIKPFLINEENMEIATSWHNDQDINYLFLPNFKDEGLSTIDADTMREIYERGELEGRARFMVLKEGKLIGEGSIEMDSPICTPSELRSAWLSLVIGEASARGRGIGIKIMQYLEEEALRRGAERIELGVFSNNPYALKLYEKMNYHFLARFEHFTWHDGVWYDDIRLEKVIRP